MSQGTDQEDRAAGLAQEPGRSSRRIRGSLLAFDVGVGKTYTALALVIRARQEAERQRQVIAAPPSRTMKRR